MLGHVLPAVVPALLADGFTSLFDGPSRRELSKVPKFDALQKINPVLTECLINHFKEKHFSSSISIMLSPVD